jgi:hypothetical protein
MTMTIAHPLSNKLGLSLLTRVAPAILAIGLAWPGSSANADAVTGQTALNAKLAAFYKDFATDPQPDTNTFPAEDFDHPNESYHPLAAPSTTRVSAFKPPTTVTATAADLLLATAAILEDPSNTISVEDIVAGAILPVASKTGTAATSFKVRSDRDAVIVSLIDQAIKSTNLAGNSAAIGSIVQAALSVGLPGTVTGIAPPPSTATAGTTIPGTAGPITSTTPTANSLTKAGRSALIGRVLRAATDSATGATIAAQTRVTEVFASFGTNASGITAAQAFAKDIILNATGSTNTVVGGNAGNVASFVDKLLDLNSLTGGVAADHFATALTIAKLVKANNSAVGATIGGGLTDLVISAIPTATVTALTTANGLRAAALDITAAAAAQIRAGGGTSSDIVGLVETLKTNYGTGSTGFDLKTKAAVAAGALKSIFNEDLGSITDIYNKFKPAPITTGTAAAILASKKTAATDQITYTSLVAVGNSNEKVGAITSQALLNQEVDPAKPLIPLLDPTKLGAAIITAISLTNPDGAKNVGATIAALTGGSAAATSVANKDLLATNLVKAAKSAQAAGATAAGIASTLAETGTYNKYSVAIAANAAAAAYISNITMQVGAQFPEAAPITGYQASYKLTDFARALVVKNVAKASDIAVGASMANPILADQIVEKVLFLTGNVDPNNAVTSTTNPSVAGKTKASVTAVIQNVSTAVDVEEVAEIVTQVATHFTIDGKAVAGKITADNALAVSNAPTIATAAATAIQLKPGVKTSNRQDELGEVAASLVGQLINVYKTGQLVYTGTQFAQINALATAISTVTGNIIKKLSTTELVDNVNGVLHTGVTLQADLSAAANIAGDVANTIFQAISALGLNNTVAVTGQPVGGTKTEFQLIRDKLLLDIPKLGGKYADYKVGTVLTDGLITIALKDGFNQTNSASTRFEDGTQVNTTGAAGYSTNPSTLNTTTKTGSIIDPETDSRPG